MRTTRRLLFVFVLGAILALGSYPATEPVPYVTAVRLTGMVDDGMAVITERAIREAGDSKAIVFIIDTPGGLVDSAINITDLIVKAPCKTIAYVKGMGAISAGALISYSCDEIVMAPEAPMGAAQPVTFGEGGMEPLGEKETSFVRAKFASLADMKGRNPDIAMAMVDKDIELRGYPKPDGTYEIKSTVRKTSLSSSEAINELLLDPENALKKLISDLAEQALPKNAASKNENEDESATEPEPEQPASTEASIAIDNSIVINPAGKLLTLTPSEAKKYGVIKYIAKDMDDLLWQLGYTNTAVVTVTPTWSEDLYKWLISPQISALLLIIGIGGLYLEFKTPGVSAPGIIGVAALAIYFGSRYVVGLADWLDIALLITGLILIAVEIFVIPGFGVVGTLGILFVLAGVVFSFTFKDFSIPEYSWEWDRLENAGFTLTMTTLAMIVIVVATWRFLPQTPLYGRLVLADQQLPAQGYTVQTAEAVGSTVGKQGVATSMLRPAGRGRFGDRTLQVVSLSEYIEEGAPIVIVQAEGNRYVVDRIKKLA